MYQGDRPGLTDKMNLVAQRQRRAQGQLATDVVARSSYPGVGALVVGYGPGQPDSKPLGNEGSVLTAAPDEPGGVRWAAGGGEIDSDVHGNVWEGPGALGDGSNFFGDGQNVAVGAEALGAGTNSPRYSVAVGYQALANVNGLNSQDVAIGWQAMSVVETIGATDFVAVGFFALGGNIVLDRGGGGGGIAIGSGANSDIVGTHFSTDFIAIGENAFASGRRSIAIGQGAEATEIEAVALGGAATANFAAALGGNAFASAAGAVAIGTDDTGAGAASAVTNLITLGTTRHTTRIPGLPAFVAGDKYLVVNASGNIHKSALGPAS